MRNNRSRAGDADARITVRAIISEASLGVAVGVAGDAGLVGARRVLDSTPLYDAVATMDTVTLIRSAIRSLLGVADRELEVELRAALTSGDGYASNAKPQICWEDPSERAALIDTRAQDAHGCLGVLCGRPLDTEVAKAAELLATVVGQDLEAKTPTARSGSCGASRLIA